MAEQDDPRRQTVRETLEQQVGELLAAARREGRRATHRKWSVTAVVVLVLILLGLVSMQVQLYQTDLERERDLTARCEGRNEQAQAVSKFAEQMILIETHNEFVDDETRQRRVMAYEGLAEVYGERLDCTIYQSIPERVLD